VTFQEAIKAALEHPSPIVNVYREDRGSCITVKINRSSRKSASGVVVDFAELDADDWKIIDISEGLE
jgi:hypothetical protein